MVVCRIPERSPVPPTTHVWINASRKVAAELLESTKAEKDAAKG